MGKLASTQQLLKLTQKQLEAMSREDLARVLIKVNDTARHRIKYMEDKGVKSPALDYIKRTGGLTGARGLDAAELRNAFMRTKQFLNAKTSTKKAADQYRKEQFEKLAKVANVDVAELEAGMSDAQKRKFWKVIDRAAEGGLISKSGKEFYKAREALAREISEGDKRRGVDTLYNKIFGEGGRLDQMYEAETMAEERAAQSAAFDEAMDDFMKGWD